MSRIFLVSLAVAFSLALLPFCSIAAAGEAEGNSMALPEPDKTGGMPLMQALALRKSERSFQGTELPLQEVSNLLWATWGINRPDGKHTAPTALNKQEILVFAAMKSGIWQYDPTEHRLLQTSETDLGSQLGGAPLTLVYAAKDNSFAGLHIGSLYQNAGLYCASAGLANVVKQTGVDKAAKALNLPKDYKVYIVQPVGYPK